MTELGKYATTVLSAYGVSILLIVAIVVLTLRKSNKARARLEALENKTRG